MSSQNNNVNYEQIMLQFFLEHNIKCEGKQYTSILKACKKWRNPETKEKMSERRCKQNLKHAMKAGDFTFYEEEEEEDEEEPVPFTIHAVVEPEQEPEQEEEPEEEEEVYVPTGTQSLLMSYGCSLEEVGLSEPTKVVPCSSDEEQEEELPLHINEDGTVLGEIQEDGTVFVLSEEEPATKEMGTQTENELGDIMYSQSMGYNLLKQQYNSLQKKYDALVIQKNSPEIFSDNIPSPKKKKEKKEKKKKSASPKEHACCARVWVDMNDAGVRNAMKKNGAKYFGMPNFRCQSSASDGDYCAVHSKKVKEGTLLCGDVRDPPKDYIQTKNVKGVPKEFLHAFVGYGSGKDCMKHADAKTIDEWKDKSDGKFSWVPNEWRCGSCEVAPHDPRDILS